MSDIYPSFFNNYRKSYHMMMPVKEITVFLVTLIIAGSSIFAGVKGGKSTMSGDPKTLAEVKQFALGEWTSISVELRPTEDRTDSGKIQPTFLKRNFTYFEGDRFTGTITLFADNFGSIPLMEFEFKGKTVWGKAHPIAEGAWEIDYVLDEGFAVTPLNDQITQFLNQGITTGMKPFETKVKGDILKKAFPLFNIQENQIVSDYDLIYFKNGMLFMGAKHVDGTPFDKPERRPNQLQIPLARVN